MLIFKKNNQMKTINNYKYILILAVVALFASCSEDDDVAVATASTNIQMIVEPFVLSQSGGLGQAGTNQAVVELGFRLTELSTTYRGSDVVITYEGNEYTIEAGDDEVVLGNINVQYELDPPTGGIPFNGMTITTFIDFEGTFEVEVLNRPSDLVVISRGGINVTATVYGRIPPITAGQLNFLLDWSPNDDAGNDLDLRLRNSGGTQFDSSLSVSNYEDVALSDSDPDDDYVVNVDPWSTSSSTIAGKMFVRHDDGTLEIFDMDLSGINSETTFVYVNKSTDMDGNVTYSVSLD